MKKIIMCLVLICVVLVGCAENTVNDVSENGQMHEFSDDNLPSWVPTEDIGGHPWFGSLYFAMSQDGLEFEKGELFLEHAGVPNLLLTSDGVLIAVYQYFSYEDQDMFDKIAYSLSEDNGKTWTEPSLINFVELPDPTGEGVKPVDPTIVELEDGRLRLYYTYHSSEDEFARMSSSVAESIDDDFVYEDGVRLSVDGIHLLDPAVIYFDGTWHHFAQQNGRAKDGYFNYHSVSEDGLEFTREDDILLNTQMLGNPILANDGIRFYGSSDGKVLSAFSTDGYTWEMDKEARIEGGGDPAVVKLPDGNFLMAYTAY